MYQRSPAAVCVDKFITKCECCANVLKLINYYYNFQICNHQQIDKAMLHESYVRKYLRMWYLSINGKNVRIRVIQK